jgi:hypothetical protein
VEPVDPESLPGSGVRHIDLSLQVPSPRSGRHRSPDQGLLCNVASVWLCQLNMLPRNRQQPNPAFEVPDLIVQQRWCRFLRRGPKVDRPMRGRSGMKIRRRFYGRFKAGVALETIRGERTISELAAKHQGGGSLRCLPRFQRPACRHIHPRFRISRSVRRVLSVPGPGRG